MGILENRDELVPSATGRAAGNPDSGFMNVNKRELLIIDLLCGNIHRFLARERGNSIDTRRHGHSLYHA
jgi:hypothetical protein